MEVAAITSQAGTHYDKIVGDLAYMMEGAHTLASAAGSAANDQAKELEKVYVQLLSLEREAKCRKAALDHVRAQHQRSPAGEADLGRGYEARVGEQMKAVAPVASDARLAEFRSAARGEDADDGGDSDSDIEMGGGGDPERQYKCPMSGFNTWLEDPVRPKACAAQKRMGCVFSRASITQHIKTGPNRGHDHVRCPIQGCNNFIVSADDLAPDRNLAKAVKKAKRRAERQAESARMEEDDLTQDLTQGGYT